MNFPALNPSLIICGGIHPPDLTDQLVTQLNLAAIPGVALHILPSQIWPYDPVGIWVWLLSQVQPQTPLLFLSFSAGVVGSIGAALAWRQTGAPVLALIAVDGWGVPLGGDFPIYRFSHDRFTHISSHWLGGGEKGFYAEPSVAHLELWAAPQKAHGYWVNPSRDEFTTAAEVLQCLLVRHLSKAQNFLTGIA